MKLKIMKMIFSTFYLKELHSRFLVTKNLNSFGLGIYNGAIEKQTKTNRGRGSEHVSTLAFLKNNAEIFKMNFYSYSPVFPIDYNGSMKY